jgi:hypothetical protein
MSDLYKLKKAPPGSKKKWQVKVETPSGGVKTVQFGARGYEDYTQHKDKSRRDNYRSRHRGDKINDPTKAGFWSWHVLWGDSTDIKKNLSAAKKKYRLNPGYDMTPVSREEIEERRRLHAESEHFEPNPASSEIDDLEEFAAFYEIYIEENPDIYRGGFVWTVSDGENILEEGLSFDKDEAYEDASEYIAALYYRQFRSNPEWARKLGHGVRTTGRKAREYAEESYRDFKEGYREARENPSRRFPRSTTVQSLIFDKDYFTKSQAKRWAAQNEFVSTGVDTKENTYRIRQHDPSDFARGTFRTISLTDGVQAVIGMPKKGAFR